MHIQKKQKIAVFMKHIIYRSPWNTKPASSEDVCSISTHTHTQKIITDNHCIMLLGNWNVTLYGLALFQSPDLFQKSVCVCVKNESGTENRRWRWDDSEALSQLSYQEKEGRALETVSQQELRAGEWLLYLVREGLQHCCVWPMCASEDKTCGSPQWKAAGHIWGSWKRAVRKVISKVLQQRPGGWDRAEQWQKSLGENGSAPVERNKNQSTLNLQKWKKKIPQQ